MDVFQFSITCKRTNNTNYTTHYVKLVKKRRESSKRNYYMISSRVIINAIIIILRADHDMPCILMYCITSGSELLVKDFKSYTDEFPLRDPLCLPQCTTIILKEFAKMHIDDAHVDNLVAKETVFHAQTRAQTRVADAAKALDEPIILTTSSDDQTGNIDKIAPPPLRAFATTTNQIALLPPPAKISRRRRAPSLPPLTKSPFTTI